MNNNLPTLAITVHSSKGRPKGHNYLENLLKSAFKNHRYIRNIVIVDNESNPSVLKTEYIKEFINDTRLQIDIFRVDNQRIHGLAGAWNLAIKKSFDLGCDYIINANDDLIIDKSIENFVYWAQSKKTPWVVGPITDDSGTGDRLRKLSNTRYALENNLDVKPLNYFSNTNAELSAREIWASCKQNDTWVIDAIDITSRSHTGQPWLNGFCFAINRKANERILSFYDSDQKYIFPITDSGNNLDSAGIKKSKWGGQEHAFKGWREIFGIDLKIIGNWYVPHIKDENNLWRKMQKSENTSGVKMINFNFVLNQVNHIQYYLPLIQEINKSMSGKISCNVFAKKSNKYNCPFLERNSKLLLKEHSIYKFELYKFSDIKLFPGVCFCIEGAGIDQKIENQITFAFTNKIDFLFNTSSSFSPSAIGKKDFREKVDYVFFPSKFFADYYNRLWENNLYMGTSRYQSNEKLLNRETILNKYGLADKKYATIVYPKKRDLINTGFEIEEVYETLWEQGYSVLVKNRQKNGLYSLSHKGDRYFEDHTNSISLYPHTTDELTVISDFIINFGSTTIEEAIFLKTPVINYEIKELADISSNWSKLSHLQFNNTHGLLDNVDSSKQVFDFLYDFDFVKNLGKSFDNQRLIDAISEIKSKDFSRDFNECIEKYYFDSNKVSENIINFCLGKI